MKIEIFEPKIVKKNQRTMTNEIEEKILSHYAHGNSYSQIADVIEDIYGVGFSKGAISKVTDKIRTDGKKEILGLYLNESKGAKFWLQVLTDLSNRGFKDILTSFCR